ncbi:alpha-crystallin B chain [Bombyx mori]|uniref:SHSP domain-containing protein n=1 Tax=Bombyx mori TaxID=7091 RepID=A0A8R2M8U1_BOMMO|nr:alpha-crystallin B chain-like [Bombyx mori]
MLQLSKPSNFGDEFVLRSVDWLENLPWHDGNIVKTQKDRLEINLLVKDFAAEQIQVKVADDFIVIEAKHEEKKDEQGFISRHFVRKYKLPQGSQPNKITSTLSADGVLKIVVPKETAVLKDTAIPVAYEDSKKPNSKL